MEKLNPTLTIVVEEELEGHKKKKAASGVTQGHYLLLQKTCRSRRHYN